MTQKRSFQMLTEMQEFATLTPAEQRYVRRSLDVGSRGVAASETWAREENEGESIRAQARLYRVLLPATRASVPDDIVIDAATELLGSLIALTAFDLSQGKLASFSAYRFLYERLLGGAVRPWLASAFVAAAALPSLHPSLRTTLLGTVTASDAAAAGWSIREPIFTPEWVEKVPVTVA